MTSPSSDGPGPHPGESDLTRSYVLVLLVEVFVIVGLYWLGRHFG